MDHENALEALSAALDGELSPQETEQLNAHLAQCPACRALAQELSALRDACGHMDIAPPPELKDQIMAHLPPQEPSKVVKLPPKTSAHHWQRWAAMAAAFALVCMAAWQLPKFLFTKQNGIDLDLSDATSGVVQDYAVTDSAAEAALPEDVGRSAERPETPAETPVQGYTASAPDADSGVPYDSSLSDAASQSESEGEAATQARKTIAPQTVMETATPAPEPKQTDAAKQEAPTPQPTLAPDSSATTSVRSLFTSQKSGVLEENGGGEDKTAQEDTVSEENGGIMGYRDTAEDVAVSEDETSDPTASLYTGYSGSGSSSYGLTPETPADTDPTQARVTTEDFEEAIPVEKDLSTYCGKITLFQGQLLGEYPMEERPDGTTWYTLPANQFWSLLQQLEDASSTLSYQFQRAGDQIDPAAPQGLVILDAN